MQTNKKKPPAVRQHHKRQSEPFTLNPNNRLKAPLILYTKRRSFATGKEIVLKTIKEITDFIPTGKANAIPMKELAAILNVNERTLRGLIQKAREQGAPICSEWEENTGYFLPADTYEAERYYNQQSSRIRSAKAALNGVTAYLQACSGEDGKPFIVLRWQDNVE